MFNLRRIPLLEGGVGTPIKQMLRYLSLGVAGEVRQQRSLYEDQTFND
jgi:hypothetical protein